MDLPSLVVVLRAALSHAPEERKAAEASLEQVSHLPRRGSRATPPPLRPSPMSCPMLLFDLTSTGVALVLGRYPGG
jgi:hypothetical protein